MDMTIRARHAVVAAACIVVFCVEAAFCQDDSTKNILKQGLLGAGTGAIAAGASGGKAGQGALIGAGTSVIGGALLDALTTPSSSSSSYRRSAPPAQYYDGQGQYYEEYYEEPPQESSTQKILKQGLVGAGSGALASGMSGGDAGKGALIGAGTSVIGGALLDALTTPSQPQRVYRRAAPPPPQQPYPQQYQQPYPQQYQQPAQQQTYKTQTIATDGSEVGTGQKRVIKKYDDNGKLISEEEIYY